MIRPVNAPASPAEEPFQYAVAEGLRYSPHKVINAEWNRGFNRLCPQTGDRGFLRLRRGRPRIRFMVRERPRSRVVRFR